MAALKLAAGEPGIDAMEFDVQLSKDGVPVLIHDYTVNRTTNGSGFVKDLTADQLRQLDAGSWFGSAFAGEKIPLLDEVLTELKGTIRLNIELKTAGDYYPGLEQKVIELIHRHEMQGQVSITSFNHESIKRVHELDPSMETGLIIYGQPTLIREQLEHTGASILSMDYHYLTKPFVTSLIEAGYKVIAWTIDDEESIQQVMEFHPDLQICSNHPDRMLRLQQK